MKITEQELKLQAYLDGELSPSESAAVARLLETDASAKALFAELQWAKAAIAANELEVKLPESREFYWSKIAREIERSEAAGSVERAPLGAWWKRLLAPLGAAVAVAAFLIYVNFGDGSRERFETALQDSNVFTFHSQSEDMSVVWVQADIN